MAFSLAYHAHHAHIILSTCPPYSSLQKNKPKQAIPPV